MFKSYSAHTEVRFPMFSDLSQGVLLIMGQPRLLFGLLLQSFLQTQLQQTYGQSTVHIRTLLTRPVFMSRNNSTMGGSPVLSQGVLCTKLHFIDTWQAKLRRSSFTGCLHRFLIPTEINHLRGVLVKHQRALGARPNK